MDVDKEGMSSREQKNRRERTCDSEDAHFSFILWEHEGRRHKHVKSGSVLVNFFSEVFWHVVWGFPYFSTTIRILDRYTGKPKPCCGTRKDGI